MNVNEFIQLRQSDWQRLEALINYRHPLTISEVHELGLLYRAAASDLALARRDYGDQRVTAFLNQLMTRAHSFIYQQDTSDFRQIVRYFTRWMPQVYRQVAQFILVAFLLFIVPALIGFRLTYANPDTADVLGLGQERDTLADHGTWTDIPVEDRPYASAFIMSNNIRVAILAFAGGITFGLFTVYILSLNGLSVGAVLGLAVHYDMGQSLLTFIVGHGVIELSVIFMAGGAGLSLAWALLNPGAYRRRDALALAARRSVALAALAVPLLIVAGVIEGFVSPSGLPLSLHLAVGVVSGLALYGYLGFSGRTATEVIAPKPR